MCFAGLWERWRPSDARRSPVAPSITTDANAALESLHDRMPVILSREGAQQWLRQADAALLKPCPADWLQMWPVSTRANSPRNNNGSSSDAVLRRLRKAADAGDTRAQQQLEDVLRGSTSVHRACVEMGWRKPTVTVKDEPVALLEAAAKRATPMEMATRA